MSKLRIAVAGCGYWGQNLIRNFMEIKEVDLRLVCDYDLSALARTRNRHPHLETTLEFASVLRDPKIDAVVIATPVSTHYHFARKALEAGKHVLVEKPLATDSASALELVELAQRRNRVLAVDHTSVYTSAVAHMKKLVQTGSIGEILYLDSVRISLGMVQSDSNVLWDLGGHDFAIMDYLLARQPVSIAATGVKHLGCPFENLAYASVRFADQVIAHFHLSWLSPVKVRTMLLGGSKRMLVYDDMEASEKLKVYDKGITMHYDPDHRERLLTGYRNGDMHAPELGTGEALQVMARDFVSAILESRAPLCDGQAGYRVVRLLESAQLSLSQNGRPVELVGSAAALHPKPAESARPGLVAAGA